MEENVNVTNEVVEETKNEEVKESNKNVDYDKLEEIINKGIQQKESSILKSYFQQMGLSEDEVKTAVNEYKESRVKQEEEIKNNSDALMKEVEELKNALKTEKLNSSINNVGYKLGLDSKSLKAVQKLANLEDVYTDSKIDEAKIEKSLTDVLDEFPGLKTKTSTKIVEVGSPESKVEKGSELDELRKAFGLKPKKVN